MTDKVKTKSRSLKQHLPVRLKPKFHEELKLHCEEEDIRMSRLAAYLLKRYMGGKIKIDLEDL